MHRNTQIRLAVVVVSSATLLICHKIENRRRDQIQKNWAKRKQDHNRQMKELQALDSDLADRVERAKFWLTVTETD